MVRILMVFVIVFLVAQSSQLFWPPLRQYTIKRDFFNQRTTPKLDFTVYLKEHGKQYRVHIDTVRGWATNVRVTAHKSKEIVAKMLIPNGTERTSPMFKAIFDIRNETNRVWSSGLMKRHELGKEARQQYLIEWLGSKIYVHDMLFTITFNDETDSLVALTAAAHSYAFLKDNVSLDIHAHGCPDLVYLLAWAAITDHSLKVVRD